MTDPPAKVMYGGQEFENTNNVLEGNVLVIEYWNLRFICNLVLGICDFSLNTQR